MRGPAPGSSARAAACARTVLARTVFARTVFARTVFARTVLARAGGRTGRGIVDRGGDPRQDARMRIDLMPTHDVHNFYLRWILAPEGKERALLDGLGGPLALEIETSCYIDLSGNRRETAKVKVSIWPHAGPQNHGQVRFWDADARRRFWVNLQDAVTTTVVDFLWSCKPGSVPPKEGVTLRVPERPAGAEGVNRAATASAGS